MRLSTDDFHTVACEVSILVPGSGEELHARKARLARSDAVPEHLSIKRN
jgi:hypothetical protein